MSTGRRARASAARARRDEGETKARGMIQRYDERMERDVTPRARLSARFNAEARRGTSRSRLKN